MPIVPRHTALFGQRLKNRQFLVDLKARLIEPQRSIRLQRQHLWTSVAGLGDGPRRLDSMKHA
jgi:hypothetical protein